MGYKIKHLKEYAIVVINVTVPLFVRRIATGKVFNYRSPETHIQSSWSINFFQNPEQFREFKTHTVAHLILRQKVEGIGTASGKTSVMWGMAKRFSNSFWNLDFQSGSLKSMFSLCLIPAKTRTLFFVNLEEEEREVREEAEENIPSARRWRGRESRRSGTAASRGAIACARVPMKHSVSCNAGCNSNEFCRRARSLGGAD